MDIASDKKRIPKGDKGCGEERKEGNQEDGRGVRERVKTHGSAEQSG